MLCFVQFLLDILWMLIKLNRTTYLSFLYIVEQILKQIRIFVCVSIEDRSSLQICKDYSMGALVYNSFYCIDYCCGSCTFRYCCSNETLIVSQEKCHNTLGVSKSELVVANKMTIAEQQRITAAAAENDVTPPSVSSPSSSLLLTTLQQSTSTSPNPIKIPISSKKY